MGIKLTTLYNFKEQIDNWLIILTLNLLYVGFTQCDGNRWNRWGCTHPCDCHQGWEGPGRHKKGLLQEK